MNEIEQLRLAFKLPYNVWAYYCTHQRELYCPIGNQPAFPFTTHIYWSAINEVERMMDLAGLTGMENPAKMPGNYLICFRTQELAEKFRGYTKIEKWWASTKAHTETMMKDALGNVPFIVYVNDYIDDGRANESGFRWKVCHLIRMDPEIKDRGLDRL